MKSKSKSSQFRNVSEEQLVDEKNNKSINDSYEVDDVRVASVELIEENKESFSEKKLKDKSKDEMVIDVPLVVVIPNWPILTTSGTTKNMYLGIHKFSNDATHDVLDETS